MVTGYDLSQILQTDQRLVFHQPIKVGDRLYCDVYLDSFRQMGGSDIIVTKNDRSPIRTTEARPDHVHDAGRRRGEVDENIAHASRTSIDAWPFAEFDGRSPSAEELPEETVPS